MEGLHARERLANERPTASLRGETLGNTTQPNNTVEASIEPANALPPNDESAVAQTPTSPSPTAAPAPMIRNGTELLDSCLDNPDLHAVCGWHKCAFRCNNNSGFLASHANWLDGEHEYNFAEEIFQKYGIPHTFAAAPSLYRFYKQDMDRMRRNRKFSGNNMSHKDMRHFPGPGDMRLAQVQPIHYLDPSTTALVKCHNDVHVPFDKTLQQLAESTIQSLGSGFNRTAVASNLVESKHKLLTMTQHLPCLWMDFQYILNGDGTVVNVDLDRCIQKKKIERAECPEDVDRMTVRYLEYVDEYLAKAGTSGS